MASVSVPMSYQSQEILPAILQTGVLVGIIDGLFASTVALFMPPTSTVPRMWQGVASVPFGKWALEAGSTGVITGLLTHFAVAFFWSAVFVLAVRNWRALHATMSTPAGMFMVAAIYGMAIWGFMSLVAIPGVVHRPPKIGPKWFVLLFGHIPFVALPMVLANRGARRA